MAELSGQSLSHYRILGPLGAGGMGEVYLAEDTHLGRQVALKVLPRALANDRQYLERFEREATAIAALNHPNIVTIYSIERESSPPFLTMELVRGSTLAERIPDGGMDVESFLDVATPLADALAAAHAQGIVHRDLKPGNVMISEEGRAKVLDFGLAKRTETDRPSGDEPTQLLTREGAIVGTAPYMSPEQLQGARVDHRSDIFSLGIILHEMATGQRPFRGGSSAALISSILRDVPPFVTETRRELPRHLGRIVHRCLEKEPAKRYQTAAEVHGELVALRDELRSGTISSAGGGRRAFRPPTLLAAGLGLVALLLLGWWLARGPAGTTGGAADTQRIVVLPFENLGPPEDAYFALGVAEEIAGRLAVAQSLRVISRRSARQYVDSDRPITEIGEELDVDYVLAGSVRWAQSGAGPSRVRITPELVQVRSGEQLWSKIFDRDMEDIFGVQTEIARTVVAELGLELLSTETAALEQKPTENVEAYQAYLRGLENSLRPTTDARLVAQQMFERALALDPDFVGAWVELAKLHGQLYFAIDRTPERRQLYDEAMANLRRLAPDSAETRLVTGLYHYSAEKDYARALAQFEELVEEQPHDAETLQSLARPQRILGQVDEAIRSLQQAVELDPKDPSLALTLIQTLQGARRLEEAEVAADRLIAAQPDLVPAYVSKAIGVRAAGDLDRARTIAEEGPATGYVAFQKFLAESVDWLERDWQGVLDALERAGAGRETGLQRVSDDLVRTAALEALGRTEDARRERDEMVTIMEDLLARNPDAAFLHGFMARVRSQRGEHDEALAAIARAEALTDPEDVWNGTLILEQKAQVLAAAGRTDEAITLVEHLLQTAYASSLTRAVLALDPIWDPLRDHPRFQSLLRPT